MKTKFTAFFLAFFFLVVSIAFSTAFAYSGFPYWVEHDENGNPLDNIWVKVNLTANEPLEFYVYYGNSTAPSYSNGSIVFEFFDDFNRADSSTIGNGWVEDEAGGSASISSNTAYLDDTSTSDKVEIYHDIDSRTTGIVKARFKTNEVSQDSILFYLGDSSTSGQISTGVAIVSANDYSVNDGGTWTSVYSGISADTYFTVSIEFNTDSDTFNISVNNQESGPYDFRYASDGISRISFITQGGITMTSNIDWVFVRKYASSEPSINYGSEETGSWTIEGYTYTKRRKVTITSTTDLQEFQVALDYSQFNDDKVYITDMFQVELNQTITPEEFYVNTEINHTCSWQNSWANVTVANLTLLATNLNDSTVLYNVTFADVSENETVSTNYTIQVSDAHDDIEFKCLYQDSEGNSYETAQTLTVQNTEPTEPDLVLLNDTIKVGETLSALAENSTDADNDSLTYEYKFYNINDSTVVQDWSTNNNYIIQQSDAHDTIRVFARTFDGINYSDEVYVDIIVSNSPPSATVSSYPEKTVASVSYDWQLSITDPDGDNDFTIDVYYYDGSLHYVKTLTNQNSSPSIPITLSDSLSGQNVTLLFNITDAYNGKGSTNATTEVLYAILNFTFLDELTHEQFNFSKVDDWTFTIYYENGTSESYTNPSFPIEVANRIYKVEFYLQFPSGNELRSRQISAGNYTANPITQYLIDITTTNYVLVTFSLIGDIPSGTFMEIYSANEGIISTQEIDASQTATFILISGKEYQIRMLQDNSVRELGKISRYASDTVYLLFTVLTPSEYNPRANIQWDIEWISNSSLKATYLDLDHATERVCFDVVNQTDTIYHSCVDLNWNVSWTVTNLNSQETYGAIITITKYGTTWKEQKYFRYGREVVTPATIPDWLLKWGAVAVIVLVGAFVTSLNAHIGLLLIIAFASLFTYFGWINIPYSLLFILGFGAILMLIKRGEQ